MVFGYKDQAAKPGSQHRPVAIIYLIFPQGFSWLPQFIPDGDNGYSGTVPHHYFSGTISCQQAYMCWDNVFTSFQQAGTGSHLTAALAYILPGLWSKA